MKRRVHITRAISMSHERSALRCPLEAHQNITDPGTVEQRKNKEKTITTHV